MTPCSRTACTKRTLGRDRKGAAALEFAIIAVPCLGLLLGLFGVAYDFYLQEALDYSLQTAARQIQIGNVPSTYGAGDFTSKIFCPVFATFADCSAVLITVQPVVDFQSASATGQPAAAIAQSAPFCIGAPGQLMFARAVYLAPVLAQFWPYGTVVTLGGSTGNALVSNAAFANENPSGAAIPGGAGC
jgi:Flp pilus assembly protein TadG